MIAPRPAKAGPRGRPRKQPQPDASWLARIDDDDLRIAAAVRERILADPSLPFECKNVTIVADGGAVTLQGDVHDAGEQQRMIALAREVDGVVRVHDQLTVGEDP